MNNELSRAVKIVDFGDDSNWVMIANPLTGKANKIRYREAEDEFGCTVYKITSGNAELIKFLGRGRIEDAIYELEA